MLDVGVSMTTENVEQECNQNVVIVEEAIMWHMEDVR